MLSRLVLEDLADLGRCYSDNGSYTYFCLATNMMTGLKHIPLVIRTANHTMLLWFNRMRGRVLNIIINPCLWVISRPTLEEKCAKLLSFADEERGEFLEKKTSDPN